MQTIASRRLHKILGKEIFDTLTVENDEVRNATGLDIDQLLRGYIFSSRNHFDQQLHKWKSTGELMQADAVFAKKPL